MTVLQVLQREGIEYADGIRLYQRASLMWWDSKSWVFSSLAGKCICILVVL